MTTALGVGMTTTNDKPVTATRPAKPDIEGLTADNEVDVVALGGKDLDTYIKYEGMGNNDELHVKWQGASPVGEPFDDIEQIIPVRDPGERGQLVTISNRILSDTLGGTAFYSYYINDDEETESFRQFCRIGLLPPVEQAEQALSVPLILESHNQVVAVNELDGSGANVWVAPYQTMREGDTLTLCAEINDEGGDPIPPVPTKYVHVLEKEDVGKVLRFRVPKNKFRVGGRAHFYYLLKQDGHADELKSSSQDFEIRDNYPAWKDDETLLDPAKIDNYDGGSLDPGGYPQGLTVRIRQARGVKAGDVALLYWWTGEVDSTVVQSLHLDASSVEGSEMQFSIPPGLLLASADLEVSLVYQIARQGRAVKSQRLQVTVDKPRIWGLPNVVGAAPESDGAVISALNVTLGMLVDVPDEFELRPGEALSVNADGDPVRGKYIVLEPEPDKPRRFRVPPTVLGANMGRNTEDKSKRFPVTYRVNGILQSPALQLRIQPLPITSYSPVTCPEVDANGLSIKKLGERNATLAQRRWPFCVEGQPLTISLRGFSKDESAYEYDLRAGQPVSDDEFKDAQITLPLPLEELKKLKVGSKLHVDVSVRFDDVRETPLPTLSFDILE
ncbi:hypothetical protein [Pseudomonas sp. NBRC 111124]|uniref:hypothetical protein n=1 Tax=Pseudomonas sp. NBRC 111124 TaxID=1661039 RepID=UPI000760D772|nr:hypothetical protein [Pseudomonas sp. NBRC 111124]